MNGAARETKSIWWYLFGTYKHFAGGKIVRRSWRGKILFTGKFWQFGREHIFHDSIGKHFNKHITCPLIGHKDVKNLTEGLTPAEFHCFKCEQSMTKLWMKGVPFTMREKALVKMALDSYCRPANHTHEKGRLVRGESVSIQAKMGL